MIQVPVPISLNPNMWTIVIEEMLLYLLVIGRWVLPRGAVTREQLSELLFAFIGIAADVMEFFSLFGEKDVRRNKILGYCLLGIWSLSILQFTMAVTVTQQPKRGRKITTVKSLEAQKSEPDEKEKLSSELGAIFISMAMQDVPFLTLRLYTIIKYNLINYSLIFFTSKNVLVISLLFYKIAVILQKRYCPEYVDEEDSGGEVKIRYRGGKEDPDRKESSASKYALDYEYAGFTPTKPNRSGPGGSPRMDSSGDLKQRNVSKQPNINVSPSTPQQKKKMNLEINAPPNGQALSPGKEDPQRAKVKDSGHSPAGSVGSASGASPAMSKSSSRPRSSDHGSLSPASPQGSSEQEGQITEPVIYTPPTQSAQPGDPEFKPYVSVVKIGD
ncbi:transmembrane protein [Plakobranchus ocellatus]|uniref:Transmembrane protein n=1 Tax=Plakobranchus ocellatus TaxID=259542 RepID=A0AAV4A3N9_9GAST|nr:transmembrane protein [Plakobranchus ocellatus]